MNAVNFFFTEHATQTFRELIEQMQEVSLIAAEKVRSSIFHKIHLIQHYPLQSSKKVEYQGLEGHFRLTTALNYKIYYKVEEERIVVLDILMDKELSKDK